MLALCTSRAKRAISEGHLSMGTVRTYGKDFSFMPSFLKGTSFTQLYQLRVPDRLLEEHTFEVMHSSERVVKFREFRRTACTKFAFD